MKKEWKNPEMKNLAVEGTNEEFGAGDYNKAIDSWFCHLGCLKEDGTNGPKGWNKWEKYAKHMKDEHNIIVSELMS